MKVHLMKTTMGWSAACFSTEGLLLLTLPCESLEAAMAEAWENFNQLMVCGEVFSSRLQAKDRASQAYKHIGCIALWWIILNMARTTLMSQ